MIAWRCLLRPIGIPNCWYNLRCHVKTRATVNQIQSTGHCSKNVDLVNSGEVFLGSDIYIYIYTYANPHFFDFFVFYSDFCLVLPSKAASIFSFIWRLWMIEHDESRCFMCRFNDIFWGYLQRFRLPYCVSKKVKYWQNTGTVVKCQFWALHWFLQCFCSFLWHIYVFFLKYAFRSCRHTIWWFRVQSFDAVLLNDMQTRWLAPDHIFKAAHPRQNRLGQLWNHFGHMPGTKRTAGEPKITVPVPVLVLGTSDLGTQQCWTDSRVLVRSDALLEETPHAINDLCAAFGLDKAASEGILVRGPFDKARLSPHPFSFHFDSFLAVTLVDDEGDR